MKFEKFLMFFSGVEGKGEAGEEGGKQVRWEKAQEVVGGSSQRWGPAV